MAQPSTQACPVPQSVVTLQSPLPQGGEVAKDAMLRCTWEIEVLSEHVIAEADTVLARGGADPRSAYLLRCLGARIHCLNSLLMSYLGDDDITLADAAHSLDRSMHRLEESLSQSGEAAHA